VPPHFLFLQEKSHFLAQTAVKEKYARYGGIEFHSEVTLFLVFISRGIHNFTLYAFFTVRILFSILSIVNGVISSFCDCKWIITAKKLLTLRIWKKTENFSVGKMFIIRHTAQWQNQSVKTGWSLEVTRSAKQLSLYQWPFSVYDEWSNKFLKSANTILQMQYTLWVKKNCATFIFTVTLANVGRF